MSESAKPQGSIVCRITTEMVRQLKLPADAERHSSESLDSISDLTDEQVEAFCAVAVDVCHALHMQMRPANGETVH